MTKCEKLLGEWRYSLANLDLAFPDLLVAGVDEAGRGPLAGPVSAAAVVLPPDYVNPNIVDSKKLSPAKREKVFEEIVRIAFGYAVVFVGPKQIDRLNIREATRYAMACAAKELVMAFRRRSWHGSVHFLVDGNVPMATNLSQETIIKGDEKVQAISAASIIAKVSRDREMILSEEHFPGYGFAVHKGYPTAYHKQKIRELGPSVIHRVTFAGVKEFVTPAER
jgi:ribonuclease HII